MQALQGVSREGKTKISFADWSSFIDYAVTTKGGSSTKEGLASFYGRMNWEQSKEAARNGWEEGTEKINKFVDILMDKLTPSLKIDEYFYDVSGQDFDLDRVLIGEPEAWMQTEQVEVKAPAKHTIRMVVQAQGLAEVSSDAMMWKGAAVVACVALLERARRRVQVDVCFYNNFYPLLHLMTIPVKQASDNLDLAKMAFALAHPSCFRRFGFAVMELEGLPGYGASINLKQDDSADVWVPKAEPYEDQKSCEKWILEELKKQGVELK